MDHLSFEGIDSFSLRQLFDIQSELTDEKKDIDSKIKTIKDELERRFVEEAQDKLHQQGKDFGSTILNRDGFKVRIQFKKTVEWEPGMLVKIANELGDENARHYISVKYSVPEAKFTAAPPEIKAKLSDARTVHFQGVTVGLEENDA